MDDFGSKKRSLVFALCLLLSAMVLRGGTVEFELFKESLDQPLIETPVRVMVAGSRGTQRWNGETDGTGRLAMPVPENDFLLKTFVFRARKMAPLEWRISKTPVFTEHFSLILEPGATGGGRVVDRRGHPVQGAVIHLKTQTGRLLRLAVTDSTGSWSSDPR